jgi:hypothetical protein
VHQLLHVIPAQAGIQKSFAPFGAWTPAFAGEPIMIPLIPAFEINTLAAEG